MVGKTLWCLLLYCFICLILNLNCPVIILLLPSIDIVGYLVLNMSSQCVADTINTVWTEGLILYVKEKCILRWHSTICSLLRTHFWEYRQRYMVPFQVFVFLECRFCGARWKKACDLPWNHAEAFCNYKVSHIIPNNLPELRVWLSLFCVCDATSLPRSCLLWRYNCGPEVCSAVA